MSLIRSKLWLLAIAATVAAPAACQDVDPYAQPDDSWIVIDGTVESVMPDAFLLDYGDGAITVEMDDGDRDADAYDLLPEDKVSVTGRIDDDLLETATIEASSVYVEDIGTTFYASAVDEEDYVPTLVVPVAVSRTTLAGTVTEVGEAEFILDTGVIEIEVETERMAYNPLDDIGYQQIEAGDRVRVTGVIDYDFFEGGVLDATHIVTLSDRSDS